jgi:pilus assembly protein CpaB
MKRRGFFLIMVSLVLAVGAAWVARNWAQARLNGGPAAEPVQTVVVAALEIAFGTKVEARHLKTITLPSNAPVGNHFAKTEEVVGLIALQKVIPGEILFKERFAGRDSGSTLAAIVRPDMRAVSVRVDDVIGVAGFLLPGNHVDVVAARMIDQQHQRAETHTVLHNLNVLAVDQTATQDKDQPVVVRAVTLEMTPKQAEVLVKAREEGRIQLTLRNPLDMTPEHDEEFASDNVHPKEPEKKAHPARPRPPPAESAGVTIIRGTNVHSSESAT